jgi:hypothetical protein
MDEAATQKKFQTILEQAGTDSRTDRDYGESALTDRRKTSLPKLDTPLTTMSPVGSVDVKFL